MEAAQERFGGLDVLVTNAGVIQLGPAKAMRRDDYVTAMDVMFWGVAHPVLAALPALRERRGRVLVVTSVGGKLPAPHLLLRNLDPLHTQTHGDVSRLLHSGHRGIYRTKPV